MITKLQRLRAFPAVALLCGMVCAPVSALGAGTGTWTGPVAGAWVGFNRMKSDYTSSQFTTSLGVVGGYDYQLAAQPVVFGGDIFYEGYAARTHSSPVGPLKYGARVWGVELSGGYALGASQQWLPYIKLGYGHADGTNDLHGSSNGLRYGVGVEWRMNTSLGFLLQFMHQKFGSQLDNLSNSGWTIGAYWHFKMQ